MTLVGSLIGPVGTVGGVLVAEKVGQLVGDRVPMWGVAAGFVVGGLALGKKGGVLGHLGHGAVVNGLLHLASVGLGARADVDFGSY